MEDSFRISRILQAPAPEAKALLDDEAKSELAFGNSPEWARLAGSLATRAVAEDSVDWALMAFDLFCKLVDREQLEGVRERLISSEMQMRAQLISRFRVADFEQHAAALVDWFVSRLTLSPEDAENNSSRWRELPIESVQKMRQIKNRLNILAAANKVGVFDCHPEISRWLALRSKLP